MRLSSSFTERFSDRVLEAAPIGWQLFVRSSSLRDQSASLTTFETFATRLLAQALSVCVFEKPLDAETQFPRIFLRNCLKRVRSSLWNLLFCPSEQRNRLFRPVSLTSEATVWDLSGLFGQFRKPSLREGLLSVMREKRQLASLSEGALRLALATVMGFSGEGRIRTFGARPSRLGPPD